MVSRPLEGEKPYSMTLEEFHARARVAGVVVDEEELAVTVRSVNRALTALQSLDRYLATKSEPLIPEVD